MLQGQVGKSSFPLFSEVNRGEISRADTGLGSTCLTDVLTGKKDFFDPGSNSFISGYPRMWLRAH